MFKIIAIKKIHNNKLKKQAALGHFNDVLGTKDVANYKMLDAICKLPKYERLYSKLRSTGMVNFVIGTDPYMPLVEMLMRYAIPPSNNEVYYPDATNASLPEDYFQDVTTDDLLGKRLTTDYPNVVNNIDSLLYGQERVVTPSWLEEKGFDLSIIDQIFSPDGSQTGNSKKIKESIIEFEKNLKEIMEESTTAMKMREAHKRLLLDREYKGIEIELERINNAIAANTERAKNVTSFDDDGNPVNVKEVKERYAKINKSLQARQKKIQKILEDKRNNKLYESQEEILRDLTKEELAIYNDRLRLLNMDEEAVMNSPADLEAISILNKIEEKLHENVKSTILQQYRRERGVCINYYNMLRSGRSVNLQEAFAASQLPEEEAGQTKFLPANSLTVRALFGRTGLYKNFSLEDIREGGFATWNPLKWLNESYKDFRGQIDRANRSQSQESIIADFNRSLEILSTKLEEYQTTDEELIGIKNNILGILTAKIKNPQGQEDPSQTIRLILAKQSNIQEEMRKFNAKASSHGKTMVLQNMDRCAVIQPFDSNRSDKKDEGQGYRYQLQDQKRFSDFFDTCAARDLKAIEGKSIPDGRRIVFISNEKIKIEGAKYADLAAFPVTDEEARIIVRHMMGPFINKMVDARLYRKQEELEEEYEDDPNTLVSELEKAKTEFEKERSKGTIDSQSKDVVNALVNAIIGLSQKDAIDLVNKTISENLHGLNETLYDEQGQRMGIYFDADTAKENLVKETNERKGQTMGIVAKTPRVKFKSFIYNKKGGWGEKMEEIKTKLLILSENGEEMSKIAKKIKELTRLRDSAKDKATKEMYSQEIVASNRMWKDLKAQASIFLQTAIPHFTILYGKPGVGKTVWGEALADIIQTVGEPISLYSVNVEQTKNKWLGETGRLTDLLIEHIADSRNCIYIFDEIDRMLSQGTSGGGGGGAAQETHETTKEQVKKFLQFFERDNQELLINRNIFVIMTTNNVANLDNALKNRGQMGQMEVLPPDDPSEFVRFLNECIDDEEQARPNHPWLSQPSFGNTPKQRWDVIRNILRENKVDVDAIAKALVGKHLGVRSIVNLVEMMFKEYDSYAQWQDSLKRGVKTPMMGLPFTTENLLGAINESLVDREGKDKLGVGDYATKIHKETSELLASKPLEEVMVPDPTVVQKDPKNPVMRKVYRLPKELQELVDGKAPLKKEEEEEDQYGVVTIEVPDPNDPTKTKLERVPVKKTKTMQDLKDEGMKEDQEEPTAETTQEKITPPAKTPEKPKKGEETDKTKVKKQENKPNLQNQSTDNVARATTSTDYLYSFLKNKGIIQDDKLVVAYNNTIADKGLKKLDNELKNNQQLSPEKAEEFREIIRRLDADKKAKDSKAFDKLEDVGVGMFWNGQCMVAPVELFDMTESEQIQNKQRK
jgi:hypothetical protein